MASCTECDCVVITGTCPGGIAQFILIPCDKQYFCRKNPHTLANALKSLENTSLGKSLDTFAVTCHSFLELSSY